MSIYTARQQIPANSVTDHEYHYKNAECIVSIALGVPYGRSYPSGVQPRQFFFSKFSSKVIRFY